MTDTTLRLRIPDLEENKIIDSEIIAMKIIESNNIHAVFL